MTEKIVENDKRPIHWLRFWPAFFVAPVLGCLPVFALPYIAIFALMVGYPVYVIVGLPGAIWYLRRYPPEYLPIILLAGIGQLALIPLALMLALFRGDSSILQAVPGFMLFGMVFGMIWAAVFTALYRALIRKL